MPKSIQTIIDRVRSGTGTTAMEYAEYQNDVLTLCYFAEQAFKEVVELFPSADTPICHQSQNAAAETVDKKEAATPVLPMRDDPHYKGTDYKSATLAKHPDTERLDWLEQNTVTLYCSGLYDMSSDAAVEVPGLRTTFTGETLRAAIDAARKRGGAV